MQIVLNLLFLLICICSPSIIYAAGDAKISGIKADSILYDSENETISANGHISAIIDDYKVYADSVFYDVKQDIVWAEGNVKIIDKNNHIILGDTAIFKDKLKRGIISEFASNLGGNSVVAANEARKISPSRFELYEASFTPCDIKCGKTPIWQIDSKKTDINYDKHRIIYRNVFFELYGNRVFYLPYFTHPTPKAPAKSGILVPNLDFGDLVVPFYYRAKSNLDFTIAPRFSKNYTLLQFEARHKIRNGDYRVEASIGNPSDLEKNSDGTTKKIIKNRFYIFTDGNFSKNNFQYGFGLKRVSDKAYLKNYYQRGDSYLESKIYLHKAAEGDYFSAEGLTFQGLRASDYASDAPLILPAIKTQNVFFLNKNESILLNIKNDFIAYNQTSGNQLQRESLGLNLSTQMISNHGHVWELALENRSDLYVADFEKPKNRSTEGQKIWYRSLPEVQGKWRYPMISNSNLGTGIKIEPIAMAVIGKKYETKYNKYGFIDASKYELSEDNIFLPNRFSGIDYHEYGNRLSYGMNSSIYKNGIYLDGFLGQLLHSHNYIEKGDKEYAGSLTLGTLENFEVFYRTRKDRLFRSIRDEVRVLSHGENLIMSASLTKLSNIDRYYADDGFKVIDNKVTQLFFDTKYQIIHNMWFRVGAGLDLGKNKIRLLNRTIGVTYLKDCVSVSAKIYDDYTQDDKIGLTQTRSVSFAVGLKIITF